ncbi:hypothetical protein JIG36_33810 [Actinoplanes sp. LDG1-06]|uniref:Uncharacterized protein n=1 Tax=Paractinoplanes ovalisporus TaxID=2810368 RepID=A0ABS2AKZ9_9ACTN|nr:neuraminidase-like domain-containing protein [Actinoplanes ovalisporus]MBM2620497.1 hypothetical protein [Actinoplanes ovalisporus]
MIPETSSPSRSQPIDVLDSVAGEASRSVYSPAAYLADLLRVVGDEKELAERRPDLAGAPTAANGYTEVPYLDIVNEILTHELERRGAEVPKPSRNRPGDVKLRTRDKLVTAVLAELGRHQPRELSDWFLIDVETGAQVMTSRVREAITAVRLYLQRHLPGREADGMRGYPEWAADRKRLLHPENYLRPSLRPDKTPAFAALERDLLDDEPGDAVIEQALRRYMDEYTETSRLIVAGGFVDTPDSDAGGARRVVVIGRSRTEPRRFSYRHAELDATTERWSPWLPIDVPIDADRVHPVWAFGRLFVFWVEAERQQVRIRYSYQKLDEEWAPVQTLGTGTREDGTIGAINLLVRPQSAAITVSCSYTVSVAGQSDRGGATLFILHPELWVDAAPADAALAYAADLKARTEAAGATDRVARLFVDPIAAADVVRFDVPDGAESWPWFSADVRGGSFLGRPVVITEPEDAPLRPLRGNLDRLPEWDRIDAAFELPGGDRYFFDNERGRYTVVPARGGRMTAAQPINSRFGRLPSALPIPGPVDAVLTRPGQHTYVFIGDRCLRYTGQAFGQVDAGYPQSIAQAAAAERLPAWPRIDLAFTDVDGTEWFGQERADLMVSSNDLDRPIRMADFLQQLKLGPDFGRIVTMLVSGPRTYVIGETRYARYTNRRTRNWWDGLDAGYPRELRGNPDRLPDDRTISEAFAEQDTVHYIDNRGATLLTVTLDGSRNERPLYATSEMADNSRVDAAWLTDDKLYLTSGREVHRYTLRADQTIAEHPDPGYPQQMPRPISAAWSRGDQLYLFSADRYCRIPVGQEPSTLPAAQPVAGAWAELPNPTAIPFDAALDSADGLFLFVRDSYCRHAKDLTVLRPYELAALPLELIRLTTGTAADLNHKLLTGGLPALLYPATQQTDEQPVSTDEQLTDAVRVRAPMVDLSRLTSGAGLDFSGANGPYYWEIFAHLPLLIAQRLQAAQRFAQARRWYEYVLAPADTDAPWRFQPLRTLNVPAERERLLAMFRQRPSDPYAIARLRPAVHRHAVVLAYVGNLLEWADLLFGQNTEESTAEAWLLYLSAQDLLGAGLLDDAPWDQELTEELTGGVFTIPENEVLAEYRSRIADRLHRIRESLPVGSDTPSIPIR